VVVLVVVSPLPIRGVSGSRCAALRPPVSGAEAAAAIGEAGDAEVFSPHGEEVVRFLAAFAKALHRSLSRPVGGPSDAALFNNTTRFVAEDPGAVKSNSPPTGYIADPGIAILRSR
jgi:hypothetical protein